jgi:XTP/dITP diphosphohydrolase
MRQGFSTLLLGTGNRGKVAEICGALKSLDIQLLNLENFPDIIPAKEDGVTYEQNAILKAKTYSQHSGLWTLADDSGLEVDALGGAPGVLSARFAGSQASDNDRIVLLLENLGKTPLPDRTARFTSVLALVDPQSKVVKVTEGICRGHIAESPRGVNGFGYDPIFVPEGFTSSFAELSMDIKDQISHRGIALRAMAQFIKQFVTSNLTHSSTNQ